MSDYMIRPEALGDEAAIHVLPYFRAQAFCGSAPGGTLRYAPAFS